MFPPEYNGTIFIAQHGSWDRDQYIGYRVMNVRVDLNGTATGYSIFAQGWLQGANTGDPGVWGAQWPPAWLFHILRAQASCVICLGAR